MKNTVLDPPVERPPVNRFAEATEPPAPFTLTTETQLERLKNRLLREAVAAAASPAMLAPLRRAANEAAALAWLEPHPLLVFPVLLGEKILEARLREQRQQRIHARRGNLIEEAA